ncbi:restriction endonuclease [Bradyrhizobium sp. UFLA05-109]
MVQAKRYSNKVDVAAVREFYGHRAVRRG